MKRVAVVGFGNILRKDDGFGVYVVNFLKENYRFEPQISLIDAGISSFRFIGHLSEYDFLIIVDVVYVEKDIGIVLKLEKNQIKNTFTRVGHDFDLSGMVEFLNADRFSIIAAVPKDCKTYQIGLSEELNMSVYQAVDVIVRELKNLGITSYKTGSKTVEEVIRQVGG